jgi:putative membrane protein
MFTAKVRHYLMLFLKGVAMGAADVVPGVSGGTVAFISGIYEELIESLRRIDLSAVKCLWERGPVAAWHHVNGNFLLAVFAGVALSLLSLAKIISHAMEAYPILVWSFFLGLVCASVIYVARQLRRWGIGELLALAAGAAFALGITLANPAQLPDTWWMLFLAGGIAICAMILPGISGSFILLLLGLYATFLQAISNFDLVPLVSFLAGCVFGLLAFSHVLSWLLRHYHGVTLAVLTGFLLGSLQMLWPWKHAVAFYNQYGEMAPLIQEPLIQKNVLPAQYAMLTGEDPQVLVAILAAMLGVALVFGLEFLAQKGAEKAQASEEV